MSFRAKELFKDLTEKLRVTQMTIQFQYLIYIIAKEIRIELIFFFRCPVCILAELNPE
jgi:hypothetical protein